MKIQLTYGSSNIHKNDKRIQWTHIAYYGTLIFLMLLFLWKATMGIIYYDELEQSFQKQHVFKSWEPLFAKSSIVIHILAGLLLLAGVLFKKVIVYGLSLTVATLSAYTSYSQLALFNAFRFDICVCIGWFEGMSWSGIFGLNLFLLFLSVFVLFITLKGKEVVFD